MGCDGAGGTYDVELGTPTNVVGTPAGTIASSASSVAVLMPTAQRSIGVVLSLMNECEDAIADRDILAVACPITA